MNDLSVLTRVIEDLEAKLAECRWAEEELGKYKILFDNISDIAYICDNRSNILYVNKSFSRLTGFRAEDFIGKSFAPLFDEENLKAAIENYSRALNGESPQFELRFKDTGILCEYKSLPLRDGKGQITGIIGTARDITERKKAELVLSRRDSVLEAIRFVSEELLETSSLDKAFDSILKRLGEAIDISRAYIFENHAADDGVLLTSQRYEWAAPGVLPQMKNPDLQGFPYHVGGFSRWVEAMERGDTIQGHISGFPDSEKAVLGSQGIKSLVAVPIFVDNRWWGFIGFDDCANERNWAQSVIDALKAAAGAIGSAMQRRLMEDKLRKTAESLAEAQRMSRIGSWEWDIIRNETRWSDGLYQIFGVEPGLFEKNAYEAFLKCVHPEDREAVTEVTRRGLADKQFNIEYRIIRPDGEVRHIYARGEVFCDSTGAPVKVLGTSQDVTERKIVEEILKKSQRSLANAQRLARVGNWDWDIAANDLQWSDEIYSIFGIEKKWFGATYETFLRFIHPDDRKSVERAVNEALYEGKAYSIDHRIVRPDGVELTVHEQAEVEFDSRGVPVRMSGTVQDITERKLAEENLKESEEKFRVIFENSDDGLLLADPETLKFYLGNRKICQMIGFNEEELRGMGVLDIHHEKDFSFFLRQFEAIRRGATPFSKCVAVKRKDGSVFYADISNSHIRLAGKNFVLGAFRDVTERKRTEDELNRYKSNLEAIFRSVKEAIISVDLNLSITEVNEAARGICGISRADIGENLKGLTRPCSLKCLDAIDETIVMKKPLEVFRLECGKIGNHHHQTVTLNTYPLIDSSGSFSGAVLVISDETLLVDLERDLGERRQLHNIIAKSDRMREIFHLIENLADIDTTVLITGESGTGKEVAAEALHYTGIRSDKPLVKVNCSAIPEYLLESELFGHVKGAFTGAVKDRTGRFELADGGTIFLDEIGDISPEMQLRLLRVIQEKEFERLGDSKTIRMDVRVITATNKDLAEKVRRGEFREDLYYRLKVVELMMPPLRERLEDLPLLEDHFLQKFNKKFKKEIRGLSPDVQKIFMNYPWPGNIRELEHAFEHAFIVCRHDFIVVSDLPQVLRDFSKNRTASGRYNKFNEKDLLVNTLEKTAWNKQKAARMLGISRTTLYRKIEKYHLE